jgi:hypothetical protein
MACKMAIKMDTTNYIGEPNVILFRKDVINKIGFFDPLLYQICDLEYWQRIACNMGLFYIPEVLTTFRVHAGSTTAENRKAKLNILDGALLMCKFLNSGYYKNLQQLLSSSSRKKLKIIMKLRLYEAKLWINKSGEDKFVAMYNKSVSQISELAKYANPGIGAAFLFQLLLLRRKINKFLSTRSQNN